MVGGWTRKREGVGKGGGREREKDRETETEAEREREGGPVRTGAAAKGHPHEACTTGWPAVRTRRNHFPPYLTESVSKDVLKESMPALIRQLILYCC